VSCSYLERHVTHNMTLIRQLRSTKIPSVLRSCAWNSQYEAPPAPCGSYTNQELSNTRRKCTGAEYGRPTASLSRNWTTLNPPSELFRYIRSHQVVNRQLWQPCLQALRGWSPTYQCLDTKSKNDGQCDPEGPDLASSSTTYTI